LAAICDNKVNGILTEQPEKYTEQQECQRSLYYGIKRFPKNLEIKKQEDRREHQEINIQMAQVNNIAQNGRSGG
jgi:hypothetical protein